MGAKKSRPKQQKLTDIQAALIAADQGISMTQVFNNFQAFQNAHPTGKISKADISKAGQN